MIGSGCIRRATVGLTMLAAVAAGPGAAAAGAAPASAAARPTDLACGQTVTVSARLAHDVGPCPGDGLVLGADGITLDLNGHQLVGRAGPDDNVGVRVPGRTRVLVKGGTVAGFGTGVAILGGSHNTVTGIIAHDNVGLLDGSGNFGDGLAIFDSTDNVLRANTVRHNGPFEGIGVFGRRSTRNQVASNLVEGNDIARFVPALHLMRNLDDGINLGAGVEGGNHTSVLGNTIRGNGLNGIDACSNGGAPCITTDDSIVGNLVQANGFGDPLNPDPFDAGDGIHLVGIRPPGLSFEDFFPPTRELVASNTVLDNAGDGIAVGTSDNRVLNNRALGNGVGLADFFFDLEDFSPDGNCDANRWAGNTFATADPICTTNAGHQVGTPPAPAPSKAAAARAAEAPSDRPVSRRFPAS